MTRMIVDVTPEQAPDALALYVAAAAAGTLGRDPDEYALDEIESGLREAGAEGFCLGARVDGRLIGLVRGARLRARRFRHVVGGVTAAVHPAHQGQGIGRALFEVFLDRVDSARPDVERTELILQAGNPGAGRLYRSLGFEEEGRLRRRVRAAAGDLIDDVFMARLRQGAAHEFDRRN